MDGVCVCECVVGFMQFMESIEHCARVICMVSAILTVYRCLHNN